MPASDPPMLAVDSPENFAYPPGSSVVRLHVEHVREHIEQPEAEVLEIVNVLVSRFGHKENV